MMQAYGKNPVQDTIVLPFLCVRMDGFDLKTFLEVSGRQWNDYLILKSLRIVISVFEFFTKNAKVVLEFWRSFQVLSTRVCILLMYGMIRVENWIQKTFALMYKIFDFHA